MTSRSWCALFGALLLASAPPAAGAQVPQSASVYPVQPLSFGLLLPGRTEVVPATDVARRAMVALAGSGQVDVTLVLPSSLSTRDGMSIPLQFGANDGGLLLSAGAPTLPLDPFQVNRVSLAPDRTAYLVLGGTALPAVSQRPGHYSARVLIIVSQPGT